MGNCLKNQVENKSIPSLNEHSHIQRRLKLGVMLEKETDGFHLGVEAATSKQKDKDYTIIDKNENEFVPVEKEKTLEE